MRTLVLLSGCLALLLMVPADADARRRGKGNPLAPFKGLSKKIDKAMNKALRGTKSSAGDRIRTRISASAQRKLRAAGVESLRLAIFELELLFQQGSTGLYHFRSMVHPSSRGPTFAAIRGRVPYKGKFYTSGLPIASYRGILAPFGRAARALLKQAKSRKRCGAWPIAPVSAAKRMNLNAKLQGRFNRDVKRAKRDLPGICKILRAMRRHTVTLLIDDAIFLARTATGKIVGLLRADMRAKGGKLHIVAKRFLLLRP